MSSKDLIGVLELGKRWHFPAFFTNWFVENQWNIFSNARRLHSSTLNSMRKDYCHLYIQQSQYVLAFQKKHHRFTDIYIYIYIEREIKCVPKMEPWDTPENSISHELTIEP